MNVDIGAEAVLFPEMEYISGIFVAVRDVTNQIFPGREDFVYCLLTFRPGTEKIYPFLQCTELRCWSRDQDCPDRGGRDPRGSGGSGWLPNARQHPSGLSLSSNLAMRICVNFPVSQPTKVLIGRVACTANEVLVRIQYKCLVIIYVFPEMKLCSLVISKTEL